MPSRLTPSSLGLREPLREEPPGRARRSVRFSRPREGRRPSAQPGDCACPHGRTAPPPRGSPASRAGAHPLWRRRFRLRYRSLLLRPSIRRHHPPPQEARNLTVHSRVLLLHPQPNRSRGGRTSLRKATPPGSLRFDDCCDPSQVSLHHPRKKPPLLGWVSRTRSLLWAARDDPRTSLPAPPALVNHCQHYLGHLQTFTRNPRKDRERRIQDRVRAQLGRRCRLPSCSTLDRLL